MPGRQGWDLLPQSCLTGRELVGLPLTSLTPAGRPLSQSMSFPHPQPALHSYPALIA